MNIHSSSSGQFIYHLAAIFDYCEETMALLLYAQRHMRRERIFRDRQNPLDFMPDEDLMQKYRLPRDRIIHVCGLVDDNLYHRTRRNHALSVSLQVLVALRYYAVGGFQDPLGQGHGLHKSTVSRCISRVSTALCSHAAEFIKFPDDVDGRRRITQKYYDLCGLPRVIGAVDGTLIPIKAPVDDEHLFVCRKGFHAMNVQVVVDIFRDVVIQYPGNAHDAYIWNNCALARRFRNQMANLVIIGYLVTVGKCN